MTLPPAELTEYLLLPDSIRVEVEMWCEKLQAVARPYERAFRGVAEQMGVSIQTTRRKFYAWQKHGWRALVNRAKAPADGRSNLDPEFIEYWKGLCDANKRKCAPAYREFVSQFKKGKPLPGIAPGTDRRTLPQGFGYDNLMRFQPSPFEKTGSRIGRSAAAACRPKIFTTRADLAVGQRYLFDDLWHDFKVVELGSRRPGRLLQLHAHDLFSGCQFARGLKARLEDPDSGKSVQLNDDEMVFLLAHVLSVYGYHPDGCILMVECGTAAIKEILEKLLYDLTGGKVTVDRNPISNASTFAGQYLGRGKGNFRFKASLESLGNLIHNETANAIEFPGQTGSNSRLNCPEELYGREKHMDRLALALVELIRVNPQLAAQLRMPFLEVNQAKWLVEEVMERINRRDKHELEGWVDAGLTTIDFDVAGVGLIPAVKYLSLPEAQRAAVEALATPVPRKLSPREAFDGGRSRLVRLRPEATARILLSSATARKEVFVGKDHLITFEDKDLSPNPMRYLAHHFAVGDEFQAVVNPWSLNTLNLFDAQLRWIGVVDAWQTISQADIAGLHEQMGRAAKIETELLAPIAARGAAMTRKRTADAKHNAGVIQSDLDASAQSAAEARENLMSAMQ